MENIIWQNLNKDGFICRDTKEFFLEEKASGIYTYRLKLDRDRVYIGSALNLAQRFRQHRYRYSIYKGNNNKFYSLVRKYGWDNIEYGIIEKINLSCDSSILSNKKTLLSREQFYLDKYSPSLNINKLAGSMLGYKHTEQSKLKLSSIHIGKSYKKTPTKKPKLLVTKETRDKLRLRSRGVTNFYLKYF